MKPSFEKTLSEVLQHKTVVKTFVSPKTNKEYQSDVVTILNVLSIGTIEEKPNGDFKYSVVDPKHNLEYSISTPTKIDVSFGRQLAFENVRGGALNNGGTWFKADNVKVVQRQ